MSKVFFDYKIDITTINEESLLDFNSLNIYDLKNLFKGRMYIFFDWNNKNRNFMFLETGILDYIVQFDELFSYIDKGNSKSFTVSNDYYSNNLNYLYSRENDDLQIYEVNSALYSIICKYKDFKKGYTIFRKKALSEIVILYPNLKTNSTFIETFGSVR